MRNVRSDSPRSETDWLRVLAYACVFVLGVTGASIWSMTGHPYDDRAPHMVEARAASAYYAGCGEHAAAEPATVPIWCSSQDQRLENLAWAAWGGSKSVATGLFTDSSCDCSSGTVTAYPVSVTFSDPVRVGTVERYQRMSVTFAGSRPAWATARTMHFLWGDSGFVSDQSRL